MKTSTNTLEHPSCEKIKIKGRRYFVKEKKNVLIPIFKHLLYPSQPVLLSPFCFATVYTQSVSSSLLFSSFMVVRKLLSYYVKNIRTASASAAAAAAAAAAASHTRQLGY